MSYKYVGMTDNQGLEFGLDGVTPVSWKFYTNSPNHIRYVWRLPDAVISNARFQRDISVSGGGLLICSYNELLKWLKKYRSTS